MPCGVALTGSIWGCVSNWTKNYGKAVKRGNQPSTSGAGNSVGTKQAAKNGRWLYRLRSWPVTWFRVPESRKRGLAGTLIAATRFGYQVLAGQQPRRDSKQLVSEIAPFHAPCLVRNARRFERPIVISTKAKSSGRQLRVIQNVLLIKRLSA